MSEKNKIKLTDIALNEATFKNSKEILKPTNINMLFGRNGTGKSTIAKVIKDDFLRMQYIKWNKPDDESNTLIHVYDEDYIRDTFAKAEEMDGVFTISDTDVKVKLEIDENNKLREQAEAKAEQHRQKRDRHILDLVEERNKAINSCWDVFKASNNDYKIQSGFNRKVKEEFFQQLLNVTPSPHDKAELRQLYDVAFSGNAKTYTRLKSIDFVFSEDTSVLSEPIIPKTTSQYAAFMNKINASGWVKEGLDKYVPGSEGLCPFCHQSLEGILQSIEESFDSSYEDMIKIVDRLYESYDRYKTDVSTLIQSNEADWFPQNDKGKHDALAKAILKTLDKNIAQIEKKKEKPAGTIAIDDISPAIDSYNAFIHEANIKIEGNNTLVSDTSRASAFSKAFRENTALLCSSFISGFKVKEKTLLDLRKAEETEFNAQNEIINNCNHRLNELDQHTTSTRPVIKAINNLLSDTGFQGFSIEPNDAIKNTYRIVYGDGTIAKKLSEGEKNFICFLYFYFTVMESPDSSRQTKEKDRVVVIDDPVSSMDGESVFVISALVRDMIENCRNAFVIEKDEDIGHQIKQIFILTHNAFFFNEIAPLYVDENDIAAFFEIKKKNNVSHIKRCVRQTYPSDDLRTEEVNSLPQQSSYASLWKEYKTVEDPLLLVGIMRRILEIYFLHDLGITPRELYQIILKDNREVFVVKSEDGSEDSNPFRLVSALLRYISYGYTTSSNELFISLSDDNTAAYKDVFKKLFSCMKQDQHYEMMMKRV